MLSERSVGMLSAALWKNFPLMRASRRLPTRSPSLAPATRRHGARPCAFNRTSEGDYGQVAILHRNL